MNKTNNNCKHWGENKPEEFFIDVGCTLGKSWCNPSKCPDYQKVKNR